MCNVDIGPSVFQSNITVFMRSRFHLSSEPLLVYSLEKVMKRVRISLFISLRPGAYRLLQMKPHITLSSALTLSPLRPPPLPPQNPPAYFVKEEELPPAHKR